MKRFLVCGDREWANRPLMEAILSKVPLDKYGTLIHGSCRGADKMAGEIGKAMGYEILPFPANWEKHGKSAGPIRNLRMLTEGKPDLVIAFHDDIVNSKGTADMIKIASKAGVHVILINEKDDYIDLEVK